MARRLTSLSLALVMAALGVVMLTGTVAANHFGTFATGLSGAEEVPGQGDPNGKGSATVRLDSAKGEVCYDVTVEGIAAPTAAHIHEGAAGAQGDPVITLNPAKIGQGEDCLTGQEEADIERIGDNPSGFYVNVHTGDFPGGAVRGQLEG